MNLNNKVALVTGAGKGIGRAIAVELAKAGAKVVVNFLDNPHEAEETLRLVREHSDGMIVQGDVSRHHEVESIRDHVTQQLGTVDILVNNAGINLRPGDWDVQDEESIDHILAVNLKGPMNGVRVFAPGMKEKGEGRIINIASTNGQTGTAQILAYSAAKAGVINMTLAMAKELSDQGITVNAVSPGVIDTDMTRGAGEDVVKWCIDNTPLHRLGTPDEIASAVRFLAESDFITGQTLVVDGGFSLR